MRKAITDYFTFLSAKEASSLVARCLGSLIEDPTGLRGDDLTIHDLPYIFSMYS